jgi:hypothetical protein
MKAIMAWTGGRAPPSQKRRWPCLKDLVGLAQFADLPLERLDALTLVCRRPGAQTLVALGLPHPVAQRLAQATDLLGDRADRRVCRAVLALMLQDHPDRTGTNLG